MNPELLQFNIATPPEVSQQATESTKSATPTKNSPLAMFLIAIHMLLVLYIFSQIIQIKVSLRENYRLDFKAMLRFIIAISVFLAGFYFMSENTQELGIKVTQPNSAQINQNN